MSYPPLFPPLRNAPKTKGFPCRRIQASAGGYSFRQQRVETGPRHQQNCADCHKENARPVSSGPQESHAAPWRLQSVANRPGGIRAAKGSPPNSMRAMYKIPPRTSSAPSPIRNILAFQFISATHNRTGIQEEGGRFVPVPRNRFAVCCVVTHRPFFGSATERVQPGDHWLPSRKKGRVSNGSESQSHSGRQV
jgi:hypothetical protein